MTQWTDTPVHSRREALKLSLGAFVPGVMSHGAHQQQSDAQVGRLPQPSLAGRPRSRVTAYENDPFVISVEEKLRCTCGCNLSVYVCRTTDFTCAVSPAMHQEVIALVEQDKNEQEIIDAFVAKHGEMVLMAPPAEGFNLVGYFVPGVTIAAVGSLMLWLLTRKLKMRAAMAGAAAHSDALEVSSEDDERIRAELAELE